METNKTDVVSALIIKDKKILVVKRALKATYFPGMVSLPGGKRENGESISKAVIREILEETGYVIQKVSHKIYTGKAVRDGVTANFYMIRCKIIGKKKVKKDGNTARKLWVKPTTLLESLNKHHFYPELVEATETFFKHEGLL